MNYLVSANTDKGSKNKENQDSLFVKRAVFRKEQLVMAVLCDGMGGFEKGEMASASLIRAFDRWFDRKILPLLLSGMLEKTIFTSWDTLIQTMNRKLYEYGQKKKLRMGTTLTVMLFWKKRYYVAHVGDSRAYELKKAPMQLTKDHTLVQQEVDQGRLTPEEARMDSRRNILLQCIGASKQVRPDYFQGSIEKDAVYLLCCDGFCHFLSAHEIYEAFRPEKMLTEEILQQTGEQAIRRNQERGELDNISVIAIRSRR